MDNLIVIFISAILVEALVEYVKLIKDKPILLVTVVIGIGIAFIFNATIFNNLGFAIDKVIDVILTGIIISRGSNYVYDIVGKFTAK